MNDFGIGGMELIASESRDIYADPDRPGEVFKYEPGRGSQNAAEARVWREAPPALKRHLAPVTYHSNEWLAMRQVDPYPSPAQMGQLHDALTQAGYGMVDFRDDNAGVLDGRPVLLDYESVFQLDDVAGWKREEWHDKRDYYP